MDKNKGLVYVYTGNGKGKTSAALGTALRSLLLGKKVVWISWYKSKEWPISEIKLSDAFKNNLNMYWMGNGFYIKDGKKDVLSGKNIKTAKVGNTVVFDKDSPEKHKIAGGEALTLAIDVLNNQLNGDPSLLVLDEVINAINDKLIKLEDVLELIKNRRNVNLILTGRNCPKELIGVADLVTDMNKIKHPYDSGGLAVSGLDY